MQKRNFKVNEEIYSSQALQQAIIDFQEVCHISYSSGGELVFECEDDVDIQNIFLEFMNYTLSICNELI